MRIFVKLMVVVLVLGLAGPFFLKKPDGSAWMRVDDLLPSRTSLMQQWANFKGKVTSSVSQVKHQLGRAAGDEQTGKTQVYRWQAADGSWQFSDTPPADAGTNAEAQGVETVYVDPNTNLIQGLPEAPVVEPESTTGEVEEPAAPTPMTVTPTQAKELMDDARDIQRLMDERNQSLEQITGDRR